MCTAQDTGCRLLAHGCVVWRHDWSHYRISTMCEFPLAEAYSASPASFRRVALSAHGYGRRALGSNAYGYADFSPDQPGLCARRQMRVPQRSVGADADAVGPLQPSVIKYALVSAVVLMLSHLSGRLPVCACIGSPISPRALIRAPSAFNAGRSTMSTGQPRSAGMSLSV